MPKKKYNYIHLLNGKEVDKTTFYRHLLMQCYEIIVYDEDNPLLNVEIADEKKADKLYNKLKRTGQMHIFIGSKSESFCIKKVKIN